MEKTKTQEILMDIVSETLLISRDRIKSKNRLKEVVDARKIYSILVKTYTGTTLSTIGRILNRNHATIIHYEKEHESQYKYDMEYREKFVNCKNVAMFHLQDLITEDYNPNDAVQTLLTENEYLKKEVEKLNLRIERIRNEVFGASKEV